MYRNVKHIHTCFFENKIRLCLTKNDFPMTELSFIAYSLIIKKIELIFLRFVVPTQNIIKLEK